MTGAHELKVPGEDREVGLDLDELQECWQSLGVAAAAGARRVVDTSTSAVILRPLIYPQTTVIILHADMSRRVGRFPITHLQIP